MHTLTKQNKEDLVQAIQVRIWQLEEYMKYANKHNADNSVLDAELSRLIVLKDQLES